MNLSKSEKRVVEEFLDILKRLMKDEKI